jgi:uncharacterized membrane protein YfcA
VLTLAALLLLVKAFGGLNSAERGHNRIGSRRLLAIGLVGGFLVGLTSVGSGTLILALLAMTNTLGPKLLVGTDLAHAFLLVGVAALAHIYLGAIDLKALGLLLIGSVPGILIGSRLAVRLPTRALRISLGGLLLTSAVGLLR